MMLLKDAVVIARTFLDYEAMMRRDGRHVDPDTRAAFEPYVQAAAQLGDMRRALDRAGASDDSRSKPKLVTWLSTRDVATRLGVTPARIRQLAKAGEIGTRLGGRWVFDPDEIDEYEHERSKKAA